MSSIRFALEKLDSAVGKLDASVTNVENALKDQAAAPPMTQGQLFDEAGNVIDVDFVAKRLDKAIETVEGLLQQEEG